MADRAAMKFFDEKTLTDWYAGKFNNISAYTAPFAPLWSIDRLPDLGPGTPNEPARSALAALSLKSFPQILDPAAAHGCIAGLWLFHDFLAESHALSQEISGGLGSYWHALMHRREPDADNAKYWFRRVGSHPVLIQLQVQAPKLGYVYTDPYDFVDFVERVRGTGSADEAMAKRVQMLEWRLLFDWCFRQAFPKE